MVERKTYGEQIGQGNYDKMLDKSFEETAQRSMNDKIARLRARTKQMAQDDVTKIVVAGILLGILDLLGDEL